MLRNQLFLLVSVFFFSSSVLLGQISADKYKEAQGLLDDENYNAALDKFLSLVDLYPNNANLNYKTGLCYINTSTDKAKSIPYLEFASKKITDNYDYLSYKEEEAPLEALFYLGKVYRLSYRFGDAEKTLLELKNRLLPNEKEFLEKIEYELAACKSAIRLMKTPVEMTVSNLTSAINTKFSEHSPVISGDESILIFTSKREGNTGGNQTIDGQFFEDIYISSFNGKKYTQARKISKNINTQFHEASIGLSFDGSKLFIYRDVDGNGDIYLSERKGSEWKTPQKLDANINSKFRETHASISLDENQIFFTSDRNGGFGGLDIYRVRKLPDGSWSKAQNLGSKINTKYDEEGPYLHPDGTSLFFASQGHDGMGGFDIFVSYLDSNDNWQTPENIGYPINTTDDDVYYIPSVDGRRAYYSSYTNNSIGDYDIFRIDLSESHIRNQVVIAGYAITPDGERLTNPKIILSNTDEDFVGAYVPDEETGKFLFILPTNRTFYADFESSNYQDIRYIVKVPEYSYDQTKQVVIFNQIAYVKEYNNEYEKLLSDNKNKVEEENKNSKENENLDKIAKNEEGDNNLNNSIVNGHGSLYYKNSKANIEVSNIKMEDLLASSGLKANKNNESETDIDGVSNDESDDSLQKGNNESGKQKCFFANIRFGKRICWLILLLIAIITGTIYYRNKIKK